MAQLKVPKIKGELKVILNSAGSYSVWNNIKSGSNKIMIPVRNKVVGEELIRKIKEAKSGEIINIST